MAVLLSFKPVNNDCDFCRIDQLQASMNARIPTICPERVEIITDCFKRTEGEPIVIRRAKAFADILEKMTVYIEPDSLIIGNQASVNFAAPVFPEYSYDWVIDELDEFEFRSGDYFNITKDTRNACESSKATGQVKPIRMKCSATFHQNVKKRETCEYCILVVFRCPAMDI